MKQMIKKLAIVLSVALVCAPMGAMAANKLIVKDATGVIDKMVVTDAGKIGINTSNPTYQFQIVGTGDPSTAAALIASPGRATGFLPSDSGGLSFMRNNDVAVNGGLPRVNDRLGYFGFGSYIGTGYKWMTLISSFTEADATATSAPTYITFATTNVNSLGATEKVRLTSDGKVGIGITTPTQKLEVYNGGVRLNNLITTSKPACDATTRGTLWFVSAAAGAADALQVCSKDAANAYAWRALF